MTGKGGTPVKSSHSHEVQLDFSVAVITRPEVEGGGGDFIHDGFGVAVFRQINTLDVALAGVARLDTHVIKIVSRVHRQFAVVLLPTAGTKDPAKTPLAKAERALQEALASLALGSQDRQSGAPAAARAQRFGVVLQ